MVDMTTKLHDYYNKCPVKISHHYTILPMSDNVQWLISMGMYETLKVIDELGSSKND